ncbi:aliphatic sulfonate ABC transporter substrate-binding protein [Aquipuribacter nitratireducens]|uniref:Aliphatic sulfonate ABC transporter substrate-binding protein n=1 Tax=Aquipuribacter nitratireducens TaxID=650104 RepID=A0ABW0GLQ9_9MICO
MTRTVLSRRTLGALAATAALALGVAACGSGTSTDDASAAAGTETAGLSTDTINLDYAYYNPASLVLKDQGWVEEAAGDGVEVTWTHSAGSNKANESLRGSIVDFGSTAGSAAFVARANGLPLKTVDVLGLPEWSAIVVGPESDITSAEDLAGKTVAATLGTDPYFFLLQTLADAGLSADDVEVVNLQHADGRTALIRGDVDAWAGLDPMMADAELNEGAQLVVRAPERNTFSVLNVREDYLEEHGDVVALVLEQYERARQWIADNPEEAAELLASESGVSVEVADTVLNERTDLTVDPVPGEDLRAVLERITPIVVAEEQVDSEEAAQTSLEGLFGGETITEVVGAQG